MFIIIYPISYSKWVSAVQVISKKSGITVVKNEDEKLIPTRCLKLELRFPDLLKLKTQTLHPLLSSGSFFLRQHLILKEFQEL
jgi:hypothetical protein